MDAFWNGILFGLLLTIFIGPVFFALIQTSIHKGFFPGVLMAVGISLSDLLYITITYLGISKLINNEAVNVWMGLGGGIIMIAFGISSILKPVVHQSVVRSEGDNTNVFKPILKGFLLNGVNPSVLIFWLGIGSMATVNYRYSPQEAVLFFAAIISTVFITDVIKTFIAQRLRKVLTLKLMKIMNRLVGAGLIAFGIRLFYYALEAKSYGL